MNIKKLISKIIGMSLLAMAYSCNAYGAELNIDGGILIGAMNVNVDGALYDVEFVEGVCADIFDGCDDKSDFTFSNSNNDGTLLSLAMQALLDQVFIDDFDTAPELTFGCTNTVECNVQTPLFLTGSTGLGITAAVNKDVVDNGQVQSLDHLTSGGGQRGYDTTNGNPFNPAAEAIVYARWTGAPVPIPAAIWLFASAFFGMLGISRLKRK